MVVQQSPQREFILSVFHRQKIDYRPNHQTLFLILIVESAVVKHIVLDAFLGKMGGVFINRATMTSVRCSCFFVSSAPEAIPTASEAILCHQHL